MPQLKHFPLPDVGEGLTEAEIVGWRVRPGEKVTVNQIIVEIETAKASVELPCPWAGRITDLLAEAGQTVQVGAPIVAIDLDPDGAETSGESQAADQQSNGQVANLVGYGPRETSKKRRPRKGSSSAAAAQQAVQGAMQGSAAEEPESVAAAPSPGSQPSNSQPPPAQPQHDDTAYLATSEPPPARVPLTKPPVRKLAKDLGVDLPALTGSGPGGVITREDVQRAAAEPEAFSSELDIDYADGRRERRVPIKGVRRATAQAMVDSAFTAPHVTEFLTIDVTPMMQLRERLKTHPEFRGSKITPLAFAAKALCMAVRRTPDVNASWDADAGEIVYKDYVHLGVAAATPRGLVVPKIRDADRMSLAELASGLESLTETARAGRTTPADMVDGTITITNVGVFGVDTGTPILNPGESAILAFGAIREMPWVVDGEVVPRQVCQLALSFDHRVVDGQQGSRFLADVGALLSDPGMALTY